MDIKELALRHNAYILEQRHYFHAHPELPLEEKKTTDAIVKQLEGMGLVVTRFAGIEGCVATLQGAKPGKTVLLRADIDGLPVVEQTNLPYTSQTPGVMHACGHDCHIAMQLGAAKILCDLKEELCGNVKFFFQPAEELAKGARAAMDQGLMKGVDAGFGMHIWSQVDAPKFNVQAGPRMASCDSFKLYIRGVSSHGSAPHLGKDAVVAACDVVTSLQSIVSRRNDPLNPLVLTVGSIHGGQRFNILANEVVMEGTIRTFDKACRMQMETQIREISESVAKAHGCTAELDYLYMIGPVVNESTELVELAQNAVRSLFGAENLADFEKITGSEDFGELMTEAPCVFGFLGARDAATPGSELCNHHECFTPHEDALHHGAAIAAKFAYDFLNTK